MKKDVNTMERQGLGEKQDTPLLRVLLLCMLVIIYTGFMAIDLFSPVLAYASSVLKYIGMLLVMALAVVISKSDRAQDGGLVIAALCFTLAADFFLLFTPYYTVGVAIFCGAQLCYVYRYQKRVFIPCMVLAAGAGAAAVYFALSGNALVCLGVMSGAYALLIFTAAIGAWKSKLPRVNKLLACVGMVCFVLCDMNVAIINTLRWHPIYRYAVLLIWFFYLPSQMLIALSIGHYPESSDDGDGVNNAGEIL